MRNFGNTNEEEKGFFNTLINSASDAFNYVTGEGIVEDVVYYTTPGEGFWANEENSSNTSSGSSGQLYDYQDLLSNYPSQQEPAQNNTIMESNTLAILSSNAPANTITNTTPNTSRGSSNTSNTPRSNTSNTSRSSSGRSSSGRSSGSSRSSRTTNTPSTAASPIPLAGEAMKKNLISAAAGVAVGVTLMAIITSFGD